MTLRHLSVQQDQRVQAQTEALSELRGVQRQWDQADPAGLVPLKDHRLPGRSSRRPQELEPDQIGPPDVPRDSNPQPSVSPSTMVVSSVPEGRFHTCFSEMFVDFPVRTSTSRTSRPAGAMGWLSAPWSTSSSRWSLTTMRWTAASEDRTWSWPSPPQSKKLVLVQKTRSQRWV